MNRAFNRRWIFARRPAGNSLAQSFAWDEAPLADLAEGEYRVRNMFLAMDPAIRTWMNAGPNYREPLVLGDVMEATAVGEIVETRNDRLKVGDLVMGMHGWEDYSVGNDGFFASQVLPQIDGVLPSHFLGALGPTGITAYFAVIDKLQPRSGETVLISAAAGAVGSIAGQICRIKGARVVGLAGSDAKCRWLIKECGFDSAVNYRTHRDRLADAIREAAPQGVDAYFDNVGGAMFDAALDAMNEHGRITLCGFISGYGSADGNPAPPVTNLWQFLLKRLTMNAFLLTDYVPRFGEAFQELIPWLLAGKIVHREHVVEGLEKAPEAFSMLFDGRNDGKMLVRVWKSEGAGS